MSFENNAILNKSEVDIESYVDSIPMHLRSIFYAVRDLILLNLPFVTEEMKYNTPFYYLGNKRLLYLASQHDKIVLGFCHGVKMSDPYKLFTNLDKKEVRHIEFKTLKDSYNSKVVYYLQESITLITNKVKSEPKNNLIYL
jgi:hypothetical protein